MKTYISDIIPKLSRFSKQLNDLTFLTNQHWVLLDLDFRKKKVFIFRKNNELIGSIEGKVEKGKWELVSNNAILFELGDIKLLLKRGFLDENILALQLDSKDGYALFINETKYTKEINNIQAINDFLTSKYTQKPKIQHNNGYTNSTKDGELALWIIVAFIVVIFGFTFLYEYYIRNLGQ